MMPHEEQVGSVLSSPPAASVLAGCRAGEEAVHLELCPGPWVGGPGRLRSCLPGMGACINPPGCTSRCFPCACRPRPGSTLTSQERE